MSIQSVPSMAKSYGTDGLATVRKMREALRNTPQTSSSSLTYNPHTKKITIQNCSRLTTEVAEKIFMGRYEGWEPKVLGVDELGNRMVVELTAILSANTAILPANIGRIIVEEGVVTPLPVDLMISNLKKWVLEKKRLEAETPI